MPGDVVEEDVERVVSDDGSDRMVRLGLYGGMVRALLLQSQGDDDGDDDDDEDSAAAEETMLLWVIQQPTLSKPNAFVSQSSLNLTIDACGHSLSILQSPSSLITPGVTGAVMWDSGIVLGKFLEHAVDSGLLNLQEKKIVELGSGCGLVGCIAALLGGEVILTDLPDRLRLLKKNVEVNLGHGNVRGSATVTELIWGDDPDMHLIEPVPDIVGLRCTPARDALRLPVSASRTKAFHFLGSDVIYSEGAVADLLDTLHQLCGCKTTMFLAGELRNDAILEYFLQAAMKDFLVGRVDQTQWHPDYNSSRVVLYVLVKK